MLCYVMLCYGETRMMQLPLCKENDTLSRFDTIRTTGRAILRVITYFAVTQGH